MSKEKLKNWEKFMITPEEITQLRTDSVETTELLVKQEGRKVELTGVRQDDWVTINGQHILFGENGEVVSGNPRVVGQESQGFEEGGVGRKRYKLS